MSPEIEFVTFVSIVAVASVLLTLATMWHRQRMARIAPATGGEPDGAIAALEARLRVVERIVTDGGFDVAQQIEALRSAPALPTERELVR